jgi:calreticulin
MRVCSWVDDAKIADPSVSKPADWDEEAPATIPDPQAVAPTEWDADLDGEWAAPAIPNPAFKV